MSTLIEQSMAYWELGMADEARELADEALAKERAENTEETPGPAAEWATVLAFNCGEFQKVADSGLQFVPSSRGTSTTALSLHYLGRHAEAVETLTKRVERYSRPHDHYQIACFLAQAGKADEAVAHLYQSLPQNRHDRGKTWLDGDLKRLWLMLAKGAYSLETAHLLVESEFDFLREWQPAPHQQFPIDPPNFRDMRPDLRPLFSPVPMDGEHPLLPVAALTAPVLVERFEQWACDEIAANQRAFDMGREIALRRVLDAQPAYAAAAWERHDLCALRYHVYWSVRNDPARLRAFEHIAGIEPLLDEVRQMLASDPEFFAKLERAAIVAPDDVDEALEILESLPSEWSGHPLILFRRGSTLAASRKFREALPPLLRACSMWPDDPAPFVSAAWAAIKEETKQGTSEVLKAVRAAAPRTARDYRMWTGMEGWLSYAGEHSPMEAFEAKTRPFRGQPDLGGHLSPEIKQQPK